MEERNTSDLASMSTTTTITADLPSRSWAELPRDVTATILSKVGVVEILTSAQQVCSSWLSICRDPYMWRAIDMRNLTGHWCMEYDLQKMCRHAVDRSNGSLLSIKIEIFGTYDLLQYIADRSNGLKNLGLVGCYGITDIGLSEAVAKFPLLEELDISYCCFSKETLETVGKCCPRLKSLILNARAYRWPRIQSDDEAFAIAENMHELRHLQMFGNKLTNNGLEAILDGCPHLESLDLRRCFNINLVENLEKRCRRIKVLRCPNDSTDDLEFNPEFHDVTGTSEEGYPSGFSDIELMSDEDDYYEFSDYDFDYDHYSDYDDFDYDDMFYD